jgi:TetR/AcrR family tetracycline transcriptional repressor
MAESALNQTTIIDEALALLNEEGLEGISLRKLAQRLGIKAPSLYHHFVDKSALLAALVERIFDAGLGAVPPHEHWQDWMRAFGRAMWSTQRRTRDFYRLIATTNIGGAQLERMLGKIRAATAHLDMDQQEAVRIQSAVQALVLGWSVFSHVPYAEQLGQTLPYDALVLETLDLLIAGEALKLAGAGARPTQAIGVQD